MGDGFARRGNGDALSAEQDFAGIGGRDAEQNTRQFRAPCTDESSEADDFASANVERHRANAASSAAEIF